jgi:hypothetical protein
LHSEQASRPRLSEYLLSAPHCFARPSPLQNEPLGHSWQDDRVFPSDPPPDEYEPAGHVEHVAAPAALHEVAEPHAAHVPAPALLAVPAVQGFGLLLPSHELPAGHARHFSRRSADAPEVYEVDSQVLQAVDPGASA